MASRLAQAAVVAAVAVWFALRAPDVGGLDALAEIVGVAHLPFYINWRTSYHPLHPELLAGVLRDEWLEPSLATALRNGSKAALQNLVKEEGSGVFSLPLLEPRFCGLLSEELAHFAASGHVSRMPNSMNEYGVVLEELGMGQVAAQLRERVLTPLAAALYGNPPEQEIADVARETAAGSCCSDHHAFTVRYEPSKQPGLDMHHDDAEVTLNVCLQAPAELPSSKLHFCGMAGTAEHRQFRFSFGHVVGRAVVHLGVHRHGVEDILGGFRENLIIWGRTAPRSAPRPVREDSRAPDPRCLSWTHDEDFTRYRELPPAALRKQQEKREAEELMQLVRAASQEQIARMPEEYRAVARLLKQMSEAEDANEEAEEADNTS